MTKQGVGQRFRRSAREPHDNRLHTAYSG